MPLADTQRQQAAAGTLEQPQASHASCLEYPRQQALALAAALGERAAALLQLCGLAVTTRDVIVYYPTVTFLKSRSVVRQISESVKLHALSGFLSPDFSLDVVSYFPHPSRAAVYYLP